MSLIVTFSILKNQEEFPSSCQELRYSVPVNKNLRTLKKKLSLNPHATDKQILLTDYGLSELIKYILIF